MSDELPKIPTEDGKIHVLLTHVDGEAETYIHLFTSKRAVEEYVKDDLRKMWEDVGDPDWEEDYRKDIAEALPELRETGSWVSDFGLYYEYNEMEWTA